MARWREHAGFQGFGSHWYREPVGSLYLDYATLPAGNEVGLYATAIFVQALARYAV